MDFLCPRKVKKTSEILWYSTRIFTQKNESFFEILEISQQFFFKNTFNFFSKTKLLFLFFCSIFKKMIRFFLVLHIFYIDFFQKYDPVFSKNDFTFLDFCSIFFPKMKSFFLIFYASKNTILIIFSLCFFMVDSFI